jgi:hypothetical protein
VSSTGRCGTNPAPTLCVNRRQIGPQTLKPAERHAFLRRLTSLGGHYLDRRSVRSWIALVALTVFVVLVAACSSQGDGGASTDSALAVKGRWSPPSDVLAVGAKVRVAYEEAPKWTSTAACGGQLKPGGRKLGEYLLDHFSDVSSVGGYACRRNTADSSRMSVHGTGRALDVFIPTSNGAADNTKGDKVANWLVLHAQRIGVQLVIWDHSIWRANGTNDAAYGGPIPHIDHVHVELTNAASALSTPWFSDPSDTADASTTTTTSTTDGGTDDGATADADVDTDGGAPSDDASSPGTPGTPGTTDAGKKDAAPVDPAMDDGAQDAPDAAPASIDPSASSGSGDPSDGLASADDEPGETDSLPEVPASAKHRSPGNQYAEDVPNSGCSAAPRGPLQHAGDSLALVLVVAGVAIGRLRRKRA